MFIGTTSVTRKTVDNGFSLPLCTPNVTFNTKPDQSTGFWRNKLWTSLVCKTYKWWTFKPEEIAKCLSGKSLYFLGDSTTRQLAALVLKWFGVALPVHYERVHPATRYQIQHTFKKFNFNVTFQFHTHFSSLTVITPLDEVKYEVDVLDNLPHNHCNFVILISPWAHFFGWRTSSYIERLVKIKASVKRLQKRCPNARVIVKSPHGRDLVTPVSAILNSNFIFYRMRKQMQAVFRDSGVYFLDTWFLNESFIGKKEIHMPTVVINQELSMLLSYVCPDG